MLIDTHCHLYYEDLKNDLQGVMSRAAELGVTRFICVGTNIQDSGECLSITENNDNIFASAGVHPHDAKDVSDGYIDDIYELMEYERMIAVGEMGLDYFRNISNPDIQKKVFRQQMEVAQDLNHPVIFHNRDADADVIEVLSEYPEVIGVAHCYSSNLETAKAFLEMGYYISFSGNLTFKNSHLPEVAKEIPLNRVLVETDSPYLSPVPHRGKPNEPGRTRFVAEKLAEIHELPFEEIAKHTTENAVELFRIP
ncbi:MAG: TatD family hydrolase [Candidatus Marinimicrobia bacterium]|nr:TatD family hydrolase [Candidatus Neomarinimicrobiota bacterium]